MKFPINRRAAAGAAAVLVSLILLGASYHYGMSAIHARAQKVDAQNLVAEILSGEQTPRMSVEVIQIREVASKTVIETQGSLRAWQNASIGASVGALQVAEVLVNVGDRVKKGQLLARLVDETITIEVKQQEANLAEAKVALLESKANAERARLLAKANAVSEQELLQATSQEASSRARLAAAEAAMSYQRLRLEKTRIVAPDSGTISYRNVTVGQVVSSGTELFRYIQGDKVEWYAELSAEKILRVAPGMPVQVTLPDKGVIKGVVRQVSPSLNESTRSGVAFVDLAVDSRAKPGMYVAGQIEMGERRALMVPTTAVVNRTGASFLMTVEGGSRIRVIRVVTGVSNEDMVEVLTELPPDAQIVLKGAALLSEGDLVEVETVP